jgi:hypothetical protein
MRNTIKIILVLLAVGSLLTYEAQAVQPGGSGSSNGETIKGPLHVIGSADVSNDLFVKYDLAVTQTITGASSDVSGEAEMGTVDCKGAADFDGTVTGQSLDMAVEVEAADVNTTRLFVGYSAVVSGDIGCGNISAPDSEIDTYDLHGKRLFIDYAAAVSGAVTGGSFDTNGETEAFDLNVENDAYVGYDLYVTQTIAGDEVVGNTVLSNGDSYSTDDNYVGDDEIIGGNLTVTGTTLHTGAVTLNGGVASAVVATDYLTFDSGTSNGGGVVEYETYGTTATDTETTITYIQVPDPATTTSFYGYSVEADFIGMKSDGTKINLYKNECAFYRDYGGDVTIQGSCAALVAVEAEGSCAFDIEADTGNQRIDVNVTGVTSQDWIWKGTVKYHKIQP